MRGTNGGSRYAMPFRVIPDLGQRPENSIQSPSKQRCHVFQHNDSRSEFANHANGLEKQSASLSVKSCPESGVGNVLAGKASADDVNPFCVWLRPRSHVRPAPDVWPVFSKNSVRILVNLHLPLADHTGPLKTKIKATDPRE
jgi:hypothetical protein